MTQEEEAFGSIWAGYNAMMEDLNAEPCAVPVAFDCGAEMKHPLRFLARWIAEHSG